MVYKYPAAPRGTRVASRMVNNSVINKSSRHILVKCEDFYDGIGYVTESVNIVDTAENVHLSSQRCRITVAFASWGSVYFINTQSFSNYPDANLEIKNEHIVAARKVGVRIRNFFK